MAEGGYCTKEPEEISRLGVAEDTLKQEIETDMDTESVEANSISVEEPEVDRFLQKIRCDRMYELRQIQHGTKPVTSTAHRGNIDHFFAKRLEVQDNVLSQGKENVPANIDNVEEHRPDTIVVEIQGLTDQRRVSNVLGTNFRRQLENIIRGSISNVTRNYTPRPTPSPQRTTSPSPVPSPREEATPPRVPLAESPLVTTDRSRSNSVHSSIISSTSSSTNSQNSLVEEVQVPVDPEVRAPIPQVFEQMRGYDVEELQRENIVQEISELVHRRLVSASLEGDFRSRLEIHMQERLAQTGTDGQSVQEFVQNIQPSQHIMRNDFSNLGINSVAGAENWDNISIASVSATAMPYTQSNLYLSREIQSLKTQLMEMKNMMKLSFDLQMDIQRSIRQEVAAAMNQGGTAAAPTTVTKSKPVSDTHCLICLDNHSDSVLYQCGHMCVCFTCGKNLVSRGSNCPVCRAPIKDIIRAFRCNQD